MAVNKPIRTPVWQCFTDMDTGMINIPVGSLVIYKKVLYYMDNLTGVNTDTTVLQAITKKNLIKFELGSGGIVTKTKLATPIVNLITTGVLHANSPAQFKISNVDPQAFSILWVVSGVNYTVQKGALEGTLENELIIVPQTDGALTVKAKVIAKPNSIYDDSDFSLASVSTVSASTLPKLRTPTYEVLPGNNVSVNDKITINIANIDGNATGLLWNIGGVAYDIAEGDLTSKINKLVIIPKVAGKLNISLAAKGSSLYSNSDYTAVTSVNVSSKTKVVTPILSANVTSVKTGDDIMISATNTNANVASISWSIAGAQYTIKEGEISGSKKNYINITAVSDGIISVSAVYEPVAGYDKSDRSNVINISVAKKAAAYDPTKEFKNSLVTIKKNGANPKNASDMTFTTPLSSLTFYFDFQQVDLMTPPPYFSFYRCNSKDPTVYANSLFKLDVAQEYVGKPFVVKPEDGKYYRGVFADRDVRSADAIILEEVK